MTDSVSQRAKHAAAKVRALDLLIGRKDFDDKINPKLAKVDAAVTDWEEKFIGQKKDQVDKERRSLTIKQVVIVEALWERLAPLCEELEDWMEFYKETL